MRVLLLAVGVFALGILAESGERVTKVGNTNIEVEWEADYHRQAVVFRVNMSNADLEWIGIGFSDHGEYNNSDLCILKDDRMRDYYIDHEHFLQMDRSQDCELLSHTRRSFSFRRKFITCDLRDYAIEPGTVHITIIGGYDFTSNMNSHKVEKYQRFGKIVDAPVKIPEIERDSTEMTILADAARVPSEVNTYWCVIKKLPRNLLNKKHHVVKMHAVVQPGNEHLVHHMQIFLCQTDDQIEYSGSCNTVPKKSASCSHVIAAWAMGEGPVYYPPEAGFPLGGLGERQFIKVEIHYNNEKKQSGMVDSSGFQFLVTPSLRPFDAGIMETGLIYSDANSIPPGQKAFPLTAFCVEDCTAHLPKGGIHIFASQLHAHLTGRKLFTSLYRNGVKVQDVNRDMHYTPHWQHVAQLRPYVHVQRGDVLTTTCVYDTTKRDKMTFGGYEITNEMCVNYLYYYPASKVEVCKSAISNVTLHNYFGDRYGLREKMLIAKKYEKIHWNQEEADSLHELYSASPLNMACLQGDGTLFPGRDWSSVPQPRPISGPFKKTRDQMECPALND